MSPTALPPYRRTLRKYLMVWTGRPAELPRNGAPPPREIDPLSSPRYLPYLSGLAPPPKWPAWPRKLAPIIAPILTNPNLALQFQPWKDFYRHLPTLKHMIPCSFLLTAHETAMTSSCSATPLASTLHASHEPPLPLDHPNDRDETRP